MSEYASLEHAKSLFLRMEQYLQERIDLEEFFQIRGYLSAREYVIKRIASFVEGPMFSPQFDRGGSFNGCGWTPRLPTDSQIVVWIFLQWYLEGTASGGNKGSIYSIYAEYPHHMLGMATRLIGFRYRVRDRSDRVGKPVRSRSALRRKRRQRGVPLRICKRATRSSTFRARKTCFRRSRRSCT